MKRNSSDPAVNAERQRWSQVCVSFVRNVVGLRVDEVSVPADTVLPHVRIHEGGLLVDVARCYPGDVLHEAGHIAIMPGAFRPLANGDLKAVGKAMRKHLEDHPEGLATHPEDPVCRALIQVSDPEVTAWQYAAAVAVGLPMQWLFPPGTYGDEGPDILRSLQHSAYVGINGLQAAHWTVIRANPHRKLPVYPQLAHWLSPV
jgi:hypothetical protein